MAWQDIADTEVDVDSPVTETLLTKIRNNNRAQRVSVFALRTSGSTNATYWNTLDTVKVYVPDLPDYSGLQRKIRVTLYAEKIALRLKVGSTTGPEQSMSGSGDVTLEVNVDASAAGTVIDVEIQGKSLSSGAEYSCVNRATWRLEY